MYLYGIITHFLLFVQTHIRFIFLISGLVFSSFNLLAQPNSMVRNLSASNGFIKNCGQLQNQDGNPNPEVLFLYPAQGYNLQLRGDGFSYDIYAIDKKLAGLKPSQAIDLMNNFPVSFHRIDVRFVNPNPEMKIKAKDGTSCRLNYYNVVKNPSGIKDVPVFSQVIYQNIYPGIDLQFCSEGGQLKYNFILKPGADPEQIRLKYEGLTSAEFRMQDQQSLSIELEKGVFTETIPASWINREDGKKHPVKVLYKILENGMAGFDIQINIPTGSSLIIDPVPQYSSATYYGGSNDDFGRHVTTDTTGNVYLSGYTYSLDRIATSGAYMSVFGGGSFDAFLAKFSPAGNRIWASYFGGSGNDDAMAAVTDDSNNVYLAGYTRSTSSITSAGAHQISFGGGYIDGFLAKFDSNGQRVWSTYYGGDGYDRCYSVISLQNNVIVTGRTQSANNISTSGSYKPLHGGLDDAFIAAFNSSGVRLWGSYYGGSGNDYGMSLAKDTKNNFYLAGHTNSVTDIASVKGFQYIFGGGNIDAYLAKFGSGGNFIWGTYIGGDQDDEGWSVTLSPDNYAYVTGFTNSTAGLVSPNAYKDSLAGANSDAFLIKISSSCNRIWSTYFGGDSSDAASSVTYSNHKIYLTGYTYSDSNISTPGAFCDTFNGVCDAFITGFDTSGYPYWSTYYGGEGYDEAFSVTSDREHSVYIAGYTESRTKIADSNAFQDNFCGGIYDAFLAKFRDPCFGYSAQLKSYTNAKCAGIDNGSAEIIAIGGTAPYIYSWNTVDTGSVNLNLNAGNWFCEVLDFFGCLDTVHVSISEPSDLSVLTTSKNARCYNDSDGFVELFPGGGTQPYSFSWNTGDSLNQLSGLKAGKYSCVVTDSNNCVDTVNIEILEPAKIIVITEIKNVSCFEGTDGFIKLSVNGGIQPYQYLWTSGDTIADITNQPAGIYGCMVTDSNQCNDSIHIALRQPDSIVINFEKADDNGSCNGYATALVSGGVLPYNYLWTPGSAIDSFIHNLCAGVYHLEIIDSNGCMAEDSVIIDLRVGIANYSGAEGIFMYPNPAEDYFQIHIAKIFWQNFDLVIYSSKGNEVINKKGVKQDERIDISAFDGGIYLVKVITGDHVFVGRLVK
jgi:hypothetical protein